MHENCPTSSRADMLRTPSIYSRYPRVHETTSSDLWGFVLSAFFSGFVLSVFCILLLMPWWRFPHPLSPTQEKSKRTWYIAPRNAPRDGEHATDKTDCGLHPERRAQSVVFPAGSVETAAERSKGFDRCRRWHRQRGRDVHGRGDAESRWRVERGVNGVRILSAYRQSLVFSLGSAGPRPRRVWSGVEQRT